MTAPRTHEEQQEIDRARNRQYNKAFFSRMTEEQRKEFYKDRYYKYKDSHNARGKRWAKENREKAQASAHQSSVRTKYRSSFDAGDIRTVSKLTEWLLQNRGKECKFCGQESTHIDHIIPLGQGGPHTFANIQMICKDCNLMKGNRTEEQFLSHIKKILDNN